MNIKGKLIKKFDTQTVGQSFKKREFVVFVEENPTYPQYIKLEFVQDKCTLLDDVKIGQTIDVAFNLQGREWTNQKGETNYFNTLQAWKIDKQSANNAHSTTQAKPNVSEPDWLNNDQDLPY